MDKTHKRPEVIVFGGFDDLRTIDIRFLQEAGRFGAVHVFLMSDAAYQAAYRSHPKFMLAERKYYLESIRYVSHLSVTDASNQKIFLEEIKSNLPNEQNLLLATLEGAADDHFKKYCQDHQLQYQVIPESAIAGFPMEDETQESARVTVKPKVMVSGCFDWVHTGHVRFFEEASAYGDLYVVVGHDANLRLLKGEGHPLFPQEERQYWVHSIRFVKQAVISTGHGWLDAEPQILSIKPDIYLVNEDGDRPEKREFLKQNQIEYIVLEREPKPGLPRRVSTDLRGF